MSRRVKINQKDNERVIVISDVHGHLSHFKKLLDQVKISDSDYLIILGDFINRGVDSYDTLKFVQNLSLRERTIILKGNHECFIQTIMSTYDHFLKFEDFIKSEYYETIIQSMMRFKNLGFDDFNSFREVYDFILANFKDELDFISNLDIIAEDEKHLYVHGGYDETFSEEDEIKFLKYDDYNTLSKVNDKYVVVGHWPASNLRHDKIDNQPYFNHEKQIIFVDGGLGVKASGELNAVIITKFEGSCHYDCIQVNDFKSACINESHTFTTEETVYINYPDYEFEIIKRNHETSIGIHKATGKQFTIFNDLLTTTSEGDELKVNYVNNFLNLEIHSKVWLVQTIGNYALVKYKDEFGWVLKRQLK